MSARRRVVCVAGTVLIHLSLLGASWVSGAQTIEYNGTATVTYAVSNIFGAPQGTYQYRGPVKINIDPSPDNNPFALRITTLTVPQKDGQFSVWSNGSITTNAGPLPLHYWDLKYEGTKLTGVLKNNHGDKGAANVNALWAPKHMGLNEGDWLSGQVFILQPNTVLSGTVSQQDVRLRIEAGSQIFTRPFTADIVATRSQPQPQQ